MKGKIKMKKLLIATCVGIAAIVLNASESVFMKAQSVWLSDVSAVKQAKTAKIGKWIVLDESETFLRIASDRPVKVYFEWSQVGWIPGDGKAHDLPIFGGKGFHPLDFDCAADATWIRAELVNANGKVLVATGDRKTLDVGVFDSRVSKEIPDPDKPGKMKRVGVPFVVVKAPESALAPGLASRAPFTPFKSSTGKSRWLYRAAAGEKLVFKSAAKVLGVPSAFVFCNKPGSMIVKWGEKSNESVKVKSDKEGGTSGPVVMDAFNIDTLEFIVESGEFEVSDVGCRTILASDLALCSLTTSDQAINAEFLAARAANDRAKIDELFRKALGLKYIDKKAKVVAIDPTVRNGLTHCGAKICVGLDADAVLDIRWMREEGEGLATDSCDLPAGWKLVRDFDMQAECQRLVDSAIADNLQGGVQFCAYKDGKCIVDVYAGKLTRKENSPAVKSDSLFPIFSTEKPLLATACHRAVEQGKMEYDKPLCTWWPELDERGFFAKLFDLDSDTRKERLTLRETLGYRTCMPGGNPGGRNNPVCNRPLKDTELVDWDFVCKVAAADRPHGVPGTTQAYLPIAYAWMLGHPLEVAMGKPLKQVLDEEVLIPAGIDKEFYFVVPRSEYSRCAEFAFSPFCEVMNTDWARQAIMPSAWAVSSAKGICKFYNRLCGFDGEKPLIAKETLDEALKPCRHESDPLPNPKSMKRDWFMLFGMGYGLWGSAERMDRVFGHGGAGGSEGLVDRDNKLIVGYTCNYGKNSTVLRDKLYEVVGMRWRYWSDNVNIQDLQMNTVNGGDYVRGITSR